MYSHSEKHTAKDLRNLLVGGLLGYSFFWIASHPTKSPVKKRLSERRYKNVAYFPNIKISRKEKSYWMHHWMNLSVLYILLLLKRKRFIKSKIAHGFLLGSILQGLTYEDRFRIIHREELPKLQAAPVVEDEHR